MVCYRAVVYIAVTLVRLECPNMGRCIKVYRVPRGVDELGRIYGEIEKEQRRGTSYGVYEKCQG